MDLRRIFYNRYKTSSIFSKDIPSISDIRNRTLSKIDNQKCFSPKYNKMTSKERYWHEMRFKKDLINKKNEENNPSNIIKRSKSIKEMRKQKKLEDKKNDLNGLEIMCRDMFNGYDPKKYKMKRSKSNYYLHSYLTEYNVNNDSNIKERNLVYTCSNIFNDKSKDKQIQKSFKDFKDIKKNNNNLKNNENKSYRVLKKQKSWSDFEKELSQRKLRYNHSKFTTDMDWKTTNTEDIRYDTESDYGSYLTDRGNTKKSFRRVNILRRELIDDNKINKEREQNKDSVKYNIFSGNDKKNELSTKVYDKYNKEKEKPDEKRKYSKKKYDFKNSTNINKYQPSIEYYEIDIPKNFDLTDVNTIRNIFTNRGLHAFKIEENSNSINNQSGKITLRIRKDNIVDEKEYNKNINNIKKLISKDDMKLNKVDGNKAKTTKIAKQRVKTPFKGELLLKPSDNQKSEKENKAKNGTETKKNVNIKAKNVRKKINCNNNKEKKTNVKLKK